jgi:hypothetical protein
MVAGVSRYHRFMRKVKILLTLFLGSILVVVFLWVQTTHAPKGSFTRQFPPHLANIIHQIELPDSYLYLSGISSSAIYLGSINEPDKFLVLSRKSLAAITSITGHKVKRSAEQRISTGTKILINPPNVHIIDGIWSTVLTGQLGSDHYTQHTLTSETISRAISLSRNSFVVLTYDTLLKTNKLFKTQIGSHVVQSVPLTKQVDGFFCTQGILNYDKASKQIFFVSQYKNEVLSLDSNLQLLYRSQTIDNYEQAEIEIDTIISGDVYKSTFSSPPLVVNRLISSSYPHFYVNSLIMADNENPSLFRTNSVIDVYQQENGRYKLSFYLPHMDNSPITDFIVDNRELIVLSGKTLQVYKLNY